MAIFFSRHVSCGPDKKNNNKKELKVIHRKLFCVFQVLGMEILGCCQSCNVFDFIFFKSISVNSF